MDSRTDHAMVTCVAIGGIVFSLRHAILYPNQLVKTSVEHSRWLQPVITPVLLCAESNDHRIHYLVQCAIYRHFFISWQLGAMIPKVDSLPETQPSTLRGTVKWVSAFVLSSHTMAMVGIDTISLQMDSRPRLVGFVQGSGGRLALFYVHQLIQVNSGNGFTMMTSWQQHKHYYYYYSSQ